MADAIGLRMPIFQFSIIIFQFCTGSNPMAHPRRGCQCQNWIQILFRRFLHRLVRLLQKDGPRDLLAAAVVPTSLPAASKDIPQRHSTAPTAPPSNPFQATSLQKNSSSSSGISPAATTSATPTTVMQKSSTRKFAPSWKKNLKRNKYGTFRFLTQNQRGRKANP